MTDLRAVRDCNPNWSTCPVAKRAWLQNNPKIIQRLKKEALRERGYFTASGKRDKTLTWYNNDRLLPIAREAKKAGLYAPTTGTREIGRLLQGYIERAFGIKRLWLKDGWKNVITGKKFDPEAAQSVYRPIPAANRFSEVVR